MQALKIATIVMGVMIIAGTTLLGVLIVRRIPGPPAPSAPLVLDEPPGTRIAGLAATDGRLALALQGGGPDRVLLLDARSLRVVGHLGLAH
ncbi:MAG: hypothetical protein JO209_07970 [Acidisphaera sp.]|nr:hypothetical protein [Acidisphaera sp.]